MYCSVFMAFYLAFFAFLLLSFLGVFKYQLSRTVYITGSFDITVILSILMYMLRLGAKVNEYFEIHKGKFIRLKKFFWKAKNNYYGLIHQKVRAGTEDKVFRDMIVKLNLSRRQRDRYIDEAILLIEITIQKLEYDQQTKPLKLMGLTCSYELLNSIYTAIASFLFALTQIFYTSFS